MESDQRTRIELASVLAIDPGGTTGWAFIKNANPHAHEDTYDIISGQIDDLSETDTVQRIMKMLKLFRRKDSESAGVALVSEDFIPRHFDASRNFWSPVRLNAMLVYAVALEGWNVGIGDGVQFQSASTGKSTMTDDMLKDLGFHIPGNPHANDATRHGLTYLRRVANSGFIHLNACAYLWPERIESFKGPKR